MNLTPHTHFDDGRIPRHVQYSALGNIYFYDQLIITEFNEGVNISYVTGIQLLMECLKHIGPKPFIIISNRVNSYSVQPNDYKYLERVPNLNGIAIVAKDSVSAANAMLESKFFTKAFAVFEDIKSASEWSQSLIDPDLTVAK
ncbi:hypothetical protein [Gilvibacter sp.]|uniref:hypothetical protein n=1 Tax=Gilvibacter sp. TaxID=2729997 RepID=UPI0025BB9956|nr:hypothetical protein [Gilvibacter sp.]NQX78692.1 hypothetical protein [Gilvibacter sp.]